MNDAAGTTPVSEYRVSRALAVRLAGFTLLLVGGVLIVVVLVLGLLGAPGWLFSSVVGIAVAVALGVCAVASRRRTLLRLDAEGYRMTLIRGAGVSQARWSEVDDVVATTVEGSRCLVLRLADGRSSTIPVDVLDVDTTRLADDLRARLDRGHGYRSPGDPGSPGDAPGR